MTKTPNPNERRDYFILDKHADQIAGQRIAKGTKTINLTASEAEFYVAGGGLSLTDPAETRAAETAPPAKLAKKGE